MKRKFKEKKNEKKEMKIIEKKEENSKYEGEKNYWKKISKASWILFLKKELNFTFLNNLGSTRNININFHKIINCLVIYIRNICL